MDTVVVPHRKGFRRGHKSHYERMFHYSLSSGQQIGTVFLEITSQFSNLSQVEVKCDSRVSL